MKRAIDPMKIAYALAFLAVTACAHPGTTPASNSIQVAAAAPGLKAIRVNGTVLNYRDSSVESLSHSAGPPIVLVHGTLGYLEEWRQQIGELSKQRRTITYSRRYHQPNPQIDDGKVYSPDLHADDLAAFVRALDLGPIDLVGHSYGGTVAVAFARRYPELLHALILEEPAVNFFSTKTAIADAKSRGAATNAGVDSSRKFFAQGDTVNGLRAFVDATLGMNAWRDGSPGTRNYLMSQMLEIKKEMSAPADVWVPSMTCADIRPITMPVLLIMGEKTLPMFQLMEQQIKACLPQAELVEIPGVGHMHTANSPALNAAILGFFQSVSH